MSRIGGIASGLDTENLIKNMVRNQRMPIDRLFQRKTQTEWKRDAYREINSKFLRLRTSAFDMRLESSYVKHEASSSDTAIQVLAGPESKTGSYTLEVTKLAETGRLISEKNGLDEGARVRFNAWQDTVDWGVGDQNKIEIRVRSKDEGEYTVIELGKFDSIGTFASKINEIKALGINALHDSVSDRLVLNTVATGENAEIQFDVADPDTQDFLDAVLLSDLGDWETEQTGANAEIILNGLATEREGNTFIHDGTSFAMRSVTTGPVSVEVVRDTEHAVKNIMAFVNLYNEIIESVNEKIREPLNRDFPPLTDTMREGMNEKEIEIWEEQAKSGMIRNDPAITRVLSDLRMALMNPMEGLTGISNLADLGIGSREWNEYGKLYVDENKLQAAIRDHGDSVTKLFTNDPDKGGTSGIARSMHDALSRGITAITTTAGLESSKYDQSILSNRIRDMESRMFTMEDRISAQENRLWKRFGEMEKVLLDLYSQSDWLQQQLNQMEMQLGRRR